ncbi:MAG: hypothetical protein Q4C87_09265 [Actinomycetaceae bacterium]|nr:hypothetical protein [Actinomycetaceae bacterium]
MLTDLELTPIVDLEASERISAMLSQPISPLEWELALNWLAERENASLVLEMLETKWLASPLSLPFSIAMGNSVDGAYSVHPSWKYSPEMPATTVDIIWHCWQARLYEVADILVGNTPRRSLIATPTHANGAIDGETFCRRLERACSAFGCARPSELIQYIPADLMAGALRLSAEDREAISKEVDIPLPSPTKRVSIGWHMENLSIIAPYAARENEKIWFPRFDGKKSSSQLEFGDSLTQIAMTSISTPESTAYLVASATNRPDYILDWIYEEVGVYVLSALRLASGKWTAETAQLLAVAFSAFRSEMRTKAAEILNEVVPSRVSLNVIAQGFADSARGCQLNRWARSFDEATHRYPVLVLELLHELLPRLERGERHITDLLRLTLREMRRQNRTDIPLAFREWLTGFIGPSSFSAAAKTAKTLLAFGA